MGSESADDEKPVHKVHVDAFYMDRHPVTNRRYRAFVEATGHRKSEYWDHDDWNGDEQPVMGVSWDDAVAFCTWAGKRLPTEAEWEKAARGGLEGKQYPWGDDDPNGRACYDREVKSGRPDPVGTYTPNGYGLFDMAGNVWEWCADWYDETYYAKGSRKNPRGPDSRSSRVLRGGSWVGDVNCLRCSNRLGICEPTQDYGDMGFRCVK